MKFQFSCLIFLSLLSFNVLGLEFSCGEEISIDTKNMPQNNQQKDLSWCFAWTTTDLLSFYEKLPLSSYDLALQYHNHDDIRSDDSNKNTYDFTLKGGNEFLALVVALQSKKGLCTEAQTNFKNNNWDELSDFIKLLSSPKRNLLDTICSEKIRQQEPFNQLSDEVILILNKLSKDKKVAALLDVSCGQRHQFKNKYAIGKRLAENYPPEKIIEKLDQLLESGEPASVAYDADFIFMGKNHKRINSNHSSTIIGRRTNKKTGECEYLIKNSWGDKCPKKAKMECVPQKGNYWVPRNVFINNVYDINWLIKK
jgi:hypothetical protein